MNSLFPEIDLSKTEAETGRPQPIPGGVYEVMIQDPEIIQNDEKGYLQLKYKAQVTSGEYEGRMIFDSLMLAYGAYPDMVQSHQKILKGLIDAVGGPQRLTTEQQLIDAIADKFVVAKVYIRKDKTGNYGDQNRVSHFLGGEPSAPARAPTVSQREEAPAASAPARQPAGNGTTKMAWRK